MISRQSKRNKEDAAEIHNRAEAMKAYARQAKNKEMEADAAEIRLRAERRLGEMMKEQPKATGGDAMRARVFKKPEVAPATLAETGIDKNLADRARKAASLPPKEFEKAVQQVRNKAHERLLEEAAASEKHLDQMDLMDEFAKQLTALDYFICRGRLSSTPLQPRYWLRPPFQILTMGVYPGNPPQRPLDGRGLCCPEDI